MIGSCGWSSGGYVLDYNISPELTANKSSLVMFF